MIFRDVDEDEIPEIAVEHYLLDKLKERIQLARQIDNVQHKIKKENHENHWVKEAADAMEIELDSDFALRYVTRKSAASDGSDVLVARTTSVKVDLRSTSGRIRAQRQLL